MTGLSVPFVALDRQYANLREEILECTEEVLKTGQVLDGPFTPLFEAEIALRTDRQHAIAVNSCSTALLITHLYYADAGHRCKNVSMPATSFVATANAAKLANYNIQFVDIDHEGLMDINQLELGNVQDNLVTYVNLYGNVIDYDKLKIATDFFADHVPIIEDAAQSFGASYKGIPSGKLGNASCLSFDPTKNLPNYGSGGMLLTDDYDLAEFALTYRDNGKLGNHRHIGSNVKMSETDCAQMIVKLRHFDKWQARRTEIATFYNDNLGGIVTLPRHSADVVHAWHKYAIGTEHQRYLKMKLDAADIQTKIHYETAVSDREAFQPSRNVCYQAQAHAAYTLSLPIYPELTDDEMEHVVRSIRDALPKDISSSNTCSTKPTRMTA
jgi:dTDP-4-amino-4,6-dideoxygalactose transaminase